MPKGNTRSDRKFGVKVWVKTQDKDIFRNHCFKYHLSMMFVGEKYIITCLKEFSDEKLDRIIEERLDTFNRIKSNKDDYEPLGIRVTNEWWQKLAFFAVRYKTSVAKICSCIFDYAIGSYEVKGVEEGYGLTFSFNRKKKFAGKTIKDFEERASDY